MASLEETFVKHVQAISKLCDSAGEKDPGIKDALDGHLNSALDDLDAIQDLLSDVKDDALAEAEAERNGEIPSGGLTHAG